MELTHASFFSGVGGLDLGLGRAGWRTVSFSEIDPYACAVLAERWPGVPNLGDILALVQSDERSPRRAEARRARGATEDRDWRWSTLWTGGFPCQDLSVAGKRRGLAGERSGLAFAFLDLAERYRPPAVLLENVPGLLNSNAGRDLGTLLGALGQLGYGWAYRVLDARHFGVPQRRRRVFILGLHARVDPSGTGAAEVLSVGSRCDRHPPAGVEAGPGAAERTVPGVDIARSVRPRSGMPQGWNSNLVSSSPDPDGVRAADGLAGRLDDRRRVAYVKGKRAQSVDDDESWRADDIAPTLNSFDVGDTRATVLAATLNSGGNDGGFRTEPGEHLTTAGEVGMTDPLLPDGLDSHRYRCCGNGVVSSVSEWIGQRVRRAVEGKR